MFQAILFDLDDTLLRNDMTAFVQSYFTSLAPKISRYFPNNDFVQIINQATQSMIQAPRSGRTLRDVFIEQFEALTGFPFAGIEPVFVEYYGNEFKSVRSVSQPIQQSRPVLQEAQRITDRLALATIPIFPRIAIEERLRWADLEEFPFSMITSFENMHCCKPNPDYFVEIAESLGCTPLKCLMVGNDHVDDLAAKAAGMKTFLVTDYERNAGKGRFAPDYRGTMQELLEFLRG
jgi:FMN phosphatase YigB (HAD superfamily)